MADLLELKYRPKCLEDYWGNKEIKERVLKLTENNSIPNNIIISGDVGTGKSSLAYILTKLILCQNKEGSTACEVCPSCEEINRMYNTGSSIVSRNVKRLSLSNYDNDTKAYLENVITSITTAKREPKVYFIDELQMIPLIEQEKLNDVTEYINPNSYVIITTSNINSIAKSIITRFSHFEVTNPSLEEQVQRLQNICKAEHIDLKKKQLTELVMCSNYNPRAVMKNLTDIYKCGSSHFYSLIKDSEAELRICIDYFDAVRQGVFGLIPFLENHEDISRVYYSLPNFIYKLFVFKYNKSAAVTPEYKVALNEIIKLYRERVLIDILDNLDTRTTYSRDKIKSLLLCIGTKLNDCLYTQIPMEDATTNMLAQSLAEHEESSTQQSQPQAKVPSSGLSNFASIHFDSNKETDISINDL